MFNSIFSCQDIIYEISTYLYHDEMRNLKLALPSIILNKDLYSERREKYGPLMNMAGHIDGHDSLLEIMIHMDVFSPQRIYRCSSYRINIYELYFPIRIFDIFVRNILSDIISLKVGCNIFRLRHHTIESAYITDNDINTTFLYRNHEELEKHLIRNKIFPRDNSFYSNAFKCDYLEACVRYNINSLLQPGYYNRGILNSSDVKLIYSYFTKEEKIIFIDSMKRSNYSLNYLLTDIN